MPRAIHDPGQATRLKRRLAGRYTAAIIAFIGLLAISALIVSHRVGALRSALDQTERLTAAHDAMERIAGTLRRFADGQPLDASALTGGRWPYEADTPPGAPTRLDDEVVGVVEAARALSPDARGEAGALAEDAAGLAARLTVIADDVRVIARIEVARFDQTTTILAAAWLLVVFAEFWFVSRPGLRLIGRHIDDYTRARQLERALRQARRNRMLGRMAGGMAHEFNNILMPIVGLSDLMRSNMEPDHPDRELLDMIIEAGDRARRLVGRVRVLDRPLTYAPADLAVLIGEAVEAAGTPAADDPIDLGEPASRRVRVTIDADAQMLVTDASALGLALVEVLRNALWASAPDGVVEVDVRRSGDHEQHIDIRVIDHGRGMSRAVSEAAFDPFFTTRTSGHGVGLGLSVAQGIVAAHGGRIDLHSEEGAFTIVTLHLPTDSGQPSGDDA